MKEFKPETTLQQARTHLRNMWGKEAVECPCCTQMVKVYNRKFNSGMAKALLLIYKISNEVDFDFIHVQNEFEKLGFNGIRIEYNKLSYWRLIETRKGENPSGANRTGYWKLTPLGISFAKGGSTIQEYVHVFDAKVRGFHGDEINIKDAIKNKFDYFQLMGFLPLNELSGGTP